MWGRVGEVFLGVWIALSPFIFGHHGQDALLTYSDFACGTLVVVLALLSFWERMRYAHLAILAVVAWMVLFAYFHGGYPAPPGYQNDILVALVLLLFAIIPNRASEPPESWRHFLAERARGDRGQPPA